MEYIFKLDNSHEEYLKAQTVAILTDYDWYGS